MKKSVATMVPIAAALVPHGRAMAGEAEIVGELQRQIARCWTSPTGVNSWTKPVTLTFELDRNGKLIGMPLIVRDPGIREYGKYFVASATRATRACAPYGLPDGDYESGSK